MPPQTITPETVKQALKDTVESPKTEEYKFDQDDAELQRQTEEFIKSVNSDGPSTSDPAAPERPKINIPAEDGHLGTTNADLSMTEALIDVRNIEVTQGEKDMFLKSLLNESPFRLNISQFNNAWTLQIRSRSVHEQRRILDVVNLDKKQKLIADDDFSMMMTKIQQYSAVLQIERINDKLMSELKIEPGTSVEADATLLRAAVAEHIERSSNIRWTAMLNALQIFETKCAKLTTMGANEDFWKPRATA